MKIMELINKGQAVRNRSIEDKNEKNNAKYDKQENEIKEKISIKIK